MSETTSPRAWRSVRAMARAILPRRFRNSQRAQALVEFAIVLPVLLLLVGGAIDFGRLFYTRVALENAAKEGAFFGASHPRCDVSQTACADPSNVTWHVQNEASGAQPLTLTIECLHAGFPVALAACQEDDTYRVAVQHRFLLVTPIFASLFGDGVDLVTSATARVLNAGFDPSATPVPTASPTTTPIPTPTAPGSCVVPNFAGSRANDAADTWDDAGFTGSVSKDGHGNFTIQGQSLAAGTTQPCTSSITVSEAAVATPTPTAPATPTPTAAPTATPKPTATPHPTPTPTPCLQVPNVVGKGIALADQLITDAGLVPHAIGDLKGPTSKGQVGSQDPVAGTCVASGSTVIYHYRPAN